VRALHFCAALTAALALAGCEHDHFVVEVRPDGEAFQRKLTCWHVYGEGGKEVRPLATEKLARIGKLYEKTETVEDGKKHVFTGRFTGGTPADVGGAGSYTHLASPLGSTSAYVERFRGSDDLEAELAKRRAAADQLTDLAIGWMQSELGEEANFDRLKNFLNQNLRQDLKNLALYGWTYDAVSGYKSDVDAEFLVRVGQYLCQRGYLSPQDVPALARAALADDPAPLLRHVQRLVADKMGIAADQLPPESLAFLSDTKRLAASWRKYVPTTDLFEKRRKQWQEESKTNPQAAKPTPDDVLEDLVGQLVFKIRLFEEDDVLELKLYCGQEPYATNGQWDAQAAAVSWSKTLRQDAPLPVLCFSLWSLPDRAFQEAHFGKVLLSGQELAEYVVWYRGLKVKEAEEWDRFLAGCRPDSELRAAAEAFRFSSDPKPDPNSPTQQPASLADTPRRLILDQLGKDEQKKQETPGKQ
jgi:hypothetical protein